MAANDVIGKRIDRAKEQADKEFDEYIGTAPDGDAPNWIRVPNEFKMKGSAGQYLDFTGETYVYRLVSLTSGHAAVYRQLKSDYYETTSEEGTCPNCQSYVKRFEDDDYLTCHRCGWQYKPLTARIKNLFG